MGQIKLRNEVKRKRTRTVVTKRGLHADVCDACEKVYVMEPFCNDTYLGELRGVFTKTPPRKGNMFQANVCSFGCASTLFDGGWTNMKEYQAYAKIGARLGRAHVTVTPYLKTKNALVEEWEEREETKDGILHPGFMVSGSTSIGYSPSPERQLADMIGRIQSWSVEDQLKARSAIANLQIDFGDQHESQPVLRLS